MNLNFSKQRYLIAGAVIVAVVLLILLVPGTADNIERSLLQFMTGIGRPT